MSRSLLSMVNWDQKNSPTRNSTNMGQWVSGWCEQYLLQMSFRLVWTVSFTNEYQVDVNSIFYKWVSGWCEQYLLQMSIRLVWTVSFTNEYQVGVNSIFYKWVSGWCEQYLLQMSIRLVWTVSFANEYQVGVNSIFYRWVSGWCEQYLLQMNINGLSSPWKMHNCSGLPAYIRCQIYWTAKLKNWTDLKHYLRLFPLLTATSWCNTSLFFLNIRVRQCHMIAT